MAWFAEKRQWLKNRSGRPPQGMRGSRERLLQGRFWRLLLRSSLGGDLVRQAAPLSFGALVVYLSGLRLLYLASRFPGPLQPPFAAMAQFLGSPWLVLSAAPATPGQGITAAALIFTVALWVTCGETNRMLRRWMGRAYRWPLAIALLRRLVQLLGVLGLMGLGVWLMAQGSQALPYAGLRWLGAWGCWGVAYGWLYRFAPGRWQPQPLVPGAVVAASWNLIGMGLLPGRLIPAHQSPEALLLALLIAVGFLYAGVLGMLVGSQMNVLLGRLSPQTRSVPQPGIPPSFESFTINRSSERLP